MERELLLLGFLRREQAHGYRLNEFIEREMTACTDIKKPTAYFLLDKMAHEGRGDRHGDVHRDGTRHVHEAGHAGDQKRPAEFPRPAAGARAPW